MADYHYSNDPKDTYRTLLSVGDKTNPGFHSDGTSLREVWTDDGDESKSNAPFYLAMDAMQMQGTRRLEFNDDGTYIYSSGNGVLDVVSDGTINIDAATDITLDADGDDIFFKAGSADTTGLKFTQSGSGDWTVLSGTSDKDFIFNVNDGGVATEVMRLDGDVSALLMASSKKIMLGAAEEYFYGDGTDIHIGVGSGGDINIPANIGLTFGDDGEKIEGDGTKMTIGGGGVDITATAASTWHTSSGDLTIGGTAQAGAINIKSVEDDEDAICLVATDGGIDITAVGAAGQDLNLACTNGSASLASGEDVADAVTILASAGGIDITAAAAGAGQDIDISNTGGSVNITATEAVTSAILLNASAGGIDIDAVDDVTIDTTDTSQGIKIGTATASVPIAIGHGTSTVTIGDNLTVTDTLTAGTFSPNVITLSHATDPILTIDNAEHAGTDGSGHCTIIFSGENGSGTEVAQRAKILVDHPSTGTDEMGDMYFMTNAGSEGTSPGTALKLEADNDAIFYGDVIISDGKMGIGVSDPDSTLEVLDTTTQLKLSYDSDSYASMTVGSDSFLTIACGDSGGVSLDDGILFVGKDSNTRGVLTLYDGTSTNQPGYVRFFSADGSGSHYLSVGNNGHLRVGSGVPSAAYADAGVPVGSQGSLVTIAATDSITAFEHAGRTNLLGEVGGNALVTLTLPDATGTGNVYKFIVSVVNTSNYKFVAPDADNTIDGQIIITDADGTAATSFVTAATTDTIILNGGTSGGGAIGDYIELTDIAANQWAVSGMVTCAAGSNIATMFSATVS